MVFSILCEPVACTNNYSIVHLSDLQNLASNFPDTYEYTFTYLDSIKDTYNISAIIITGDLVNDGESEKEWTVYSQSIKKTSIPIYVIAGNHDTLSGFVYLWFFKYTKNNDYYYVTPLNDFNLIGIDYHFRSISNHTITDITNKLKNSTLQFNIFATHYYMASPGNRSKQGNDIYNKLIDRPSIVMSGHVHPQKLNITYKEGKIPVIEDITNYQFGDKDAVSAGTNVSAGTLYEVNTNEGIIEKITAREIKISPVQNLGVIETVYSR